MKTTSVTFRINEELKRDTEQTLEEMGLTMSGAFQLMAKAIVRTGRFPLELMVDPFYKAENQNELRRRIEGFESGETHMVDMTEEFS